MPEVFGVDFCSPKEIAERVENLGVTRTNLPLLSQVTLGVLCNVLVCLTSAATPRRGHART